MDRRTRIALWGAAAGVMTLVGLWLAAVATDAAGPLDRAASDGFAGLLGPRTGLLAQGIVHLADPAVFLLVATGLIVVALLQHRPRLALAVSLILVGANVTTQLLKPALAEPRFADLLGGAQVGAVSWPSGHSTAAMSLALCAILVAPSRLRPLVAPIGAAYAICIGYGLIAIVSHYPSDVFGGYLMAGTWTLLGVAGLWAAESRWPVNTGRTAGRAAVMRARDAITPTAIAVAAAVAAAGLVAVARPGETLAYLQDHTIFGVVAVALAALAASLVATLAVALRR
jgi:membrane-associated phospholipid phosphatase